jgi:hypothetical protein
MALCATNIQAFAFTGLTAVFVNPRDTMTRRQALRNSKMVSAAEDLIAPESLADT